MKNWKKLTALLVAASMTLSMLSVSALATAEGADVPDDVTAGQEEQLSGQEGQTGETCAVCGQPLAECACEEEVETCAVCGQPLAECACQEEPVEEPAPCEHEWDEGTPAEGGTQYTCALCGESHFLAVKDNSFNVQTIEAGDEEPVAQVGDRSYADLQQAIDEAPDDGIVTLMADYAIPDNGDGWTSVSINKTNLTLDLNSHTLTGIIWNYGGLTITGNGRIDSGMCAIENWNATAELTIENGSFYNTNMDPALLNARGAKATIKGGTFNGGFGSVLNTNGAEMTIENGTFLSDVRNGLSDDENASTMIVNNGTFGSESALNGLGNGKGTVTINGGTFTGGTGYSSVQNRAEMIITAGTFARDGRSGAALTNTGSTADLTIKGGTFSGWCPANVSNQEVCSAIQVTEGAKASIQNGEFNGMKCAVYCDSDARFITGGTFNSDVSAYVDPSAVMSESDGAYTVSSLTEENAAAKIGDKCYATVQTALNVAGDGDVVEVLKNCDEAITMPLKSITLKGAEGKPVLSGGVTLTGGSAAGMDMTIEGLTFQGNGIKAVGWTNITAMEQATGLTIRNNVFDGCGTYDATANSYVYAIHLNNNDTSINGLTVTGNEFNNSPTGALYASVKGTAVITGNAVTNSGFNGMTLNGKNNKGAVQLTALTMTGNTFDTWGTGTKNEGRALRLSGIECPADITENSFVCESAPEEFIKYDATASGKLNLNNNYWGGETEPTYGTGAGKHVYENGVSGKPESCELEAYYTDTEKTNLVMVTDSEAVAQVGNSYYTTLQEAMAAAADGDVITVLKDVPLTNQVRLNKNVTIQGAEDPKPVITLNTAEGRGFITDHEEGRMVTFKNLKMVAATNGMQFIYQDGNYARTITVDNCEFTMAEGVTSTGSVLTSYITSEDNNGKVIFTNNTVDLLTSSMLPGLGNDSVVTGNTFTMQADRTSETSRTGIMSLAKSAAAVTVTGNVFRGANRVLAIDDSAKITPAGLKYEENAFIDCLWAFELDSGKGQAGYDLAKNYYKYGENEAGAARAEDGAKKTGGLTHFDEAIAADASSVAVSSYYKTYNADGLSDLVELFVAEVNGEKYLTLQEAVEAAQTNDTITLLRDLVLPDAPNSFTEYNLPDGAVLDLGGHSLTTGFAAAAFRGKATIQNGKLVNASDYAIWIGNGSVDTKITLKDIEANGGVNVYAAEAVLENCTIDASTKGYYAIWADSDNAKVTVKSGTYTAGRIGAVVNATAGVNIDGTITPGMVEIQGGTFNGELWTEKRTVEGEVKSGKVVVSGGIFDMAVDPAYCDEGFLPVKSGDTYGVTEATLGLTASSTSMSGGGVLTLTVTPAGLSAAVTVTGVNGETPVELTAGENGTYTVTLPNTTAPYVFTAAMGETTAVVTVNVTQYTPSSGGSDDDYTPSRPNTPNEEEENVGDNDTPLGEKPMLFEDVTEDSWYYVAVADVFQRGMMTGVSETIFAPNTDTTRGMIVTMLHRLEGAPDVSGQKLGFADVEEDQWYAEGVRWALQNKVAEGYGDDTFGPEHIVTREQLAAILYRYAQRKGYDVTADKDLSVFQDAGQVSDWAVPAMRWAVAMGLLKGTSEVTLSPEKNASRAEVATILSRFASLFIEKDDVLIAK